MTESSIDVPRTADDITVWLRGRVAHYLRRPVEDIDPDGSFQSYGLDSVYGLALTAEIEDTLGVEVEPTAIWDVDTLRQLSEYVAGLSHA